MVEIRLTSEQEKILKDENNIVVTAKPGSGKTFTIIEKIRLISKDLLNYQGVIAISYTNKASKELENRLKKENINQGKSYLGTIDKFYISEIIKPFSKLLFNKQIDFKIINNFENYPEYMVLDELKQTNHRSNLYDLLYKSLEKGLISLSICGETALYIIEHIPQVLKYLSAKYTHIFIDEYQDCGLSQHKVFLKLVDSGIIGIAVGDLNQSIFAFAKKYPKYLEELTLSEQFIHCQLTVNHRCHHSISDYSLEPLEKEYERQPSNDLRVFKINIEGTEINIAREIEKKLNSLKSTYNIQNNNDFAILCKSNNIADLYSRILKIPNKVFKDTPLDRNNDAHSKIFKDLLLFYYSYQLKNDTINEFVNTYIHESNSKNFRIGLDIIYNIVNKKEESLIDILECFINFSQLITTLDLDPEVINSLENVLQNKEQLSSFKPSSKDDINIMTLHKSKGLEFQCIFLMEVYEYILPKYLSTYNEIKQELNLHYVGITRAIDACFILIGEERYNSYQNRYVKAKESPFLNKNRLQKFRQNIKW